MIIYEDGAFVTDNDYPDTDFSGGGAKYVIPDNSELAAKVHEYFPHYKIIEDDSGNIADVIRTVQDDYTPTQADYNLDFDYRLSCLELGLF